MGKGIWGHVTARVPPPAAGSPLWRPWHALTRLNTTVFRLSGGRLLGRYDRAPVLVLHHRGARSGRPRQTPLVYLEDGERIVLVASMGGHARNPAWLHNVRAHPDVTVELGGGRRRMRARVAVGDERAQLWPRLLEVWPAWEDYQARTSRTIPVLVLEPA